LIILGDSTTVLEEADRDEVLQPQLIEFTYTLWIGQNLTEIYNLNMKIPVNTSFYEAMLIAAETDSNYQFVNQTTNHFHTIISFLLCLFLLLGFQPMFGPTGIILTALVVIPNSTSDSITGFYSYFLKCPILTILLRL